MAGKCIIDKVVNVFTVEFCMSDEFFQNLNTPKNLYHALLKEKCSKIKEVKFSYPNMKFIGDRNSSMGIWGSEGVGKEYIVIILMEQKIGLK